jgi:hypothetical protein
LNVKKLAVHILKFLLSYLDEFHQSALHAEKRGPETLSAASISIGTMISVRLHWITKNRDALPAE